MIGNITARKEYAYTTGAVGTATKTVKYYYPNEDIPYEDGTKKLTSSSWNNLLLAVDLDGSQKITDDETIEYDEIGNPVEYLNHDMSWFGRQLEKINVGANTTDTADDKTIEFKYGADGLRRTKNVTTGNSTVTSEYVYANDLLIYEKRGNKELYFYYDGLGHLTAVRYYSNASSTSYKQYYVATNMAGDVLAFVDGDGDVVAEYEYDAWGNCKVVNDTTSVKISNLNPIRYRGYYLDSETGYYYLQSRYYDPSIGRFISGDLYVSTGIGILGHNMFAYCNNSPIITKDQNGEILCTLLGATIGALTSVLFKSIETDDPEELKAAALSGAISGAISGFGADVLIFTGGTAGAFVLVGAGLGGIGNVAGTVSEKLYLGKADEITAVDIFSSFFIGAGTGALFNSTSPGATSILESVADTAGEYAVKNIVKTYWNQFWGDFGINVITETLNNIFTWFLGLPFAA